MNGYQLEIYEKAPMGGRLLFVTFDPAEALIHVRDAKKAGLNPGLVWAQGWDASVFEGDVEKALKEWVAAGGYSVP